MKKVKLKKSIAVSLSLALTVSLTIFVIMLLFNVTDYGITIASFGATLFMVISSKNVSKKKIYGSYLIATFIGMLFAKISSLESLNVAMAAVSSFIFMTLMELQHAPAIGIAVSMVLNKFSILTDVVVLMCIFFIISMTLLLKLFILDPEKVINFVEIEEEKIKWNLPKKPQPEYVRVKKQQNF